MLKIRHDFPMLSPKRYCDDTLLAEDVEFRHELASLLRKHAIPKQLGDKFDHYELIVDRADRPIAAEFFFLGNNEHGASHSVAPLMRDLISELRTARGIAPVPRPKDMFGEHL